MQIIVEDTGKGVSYRDAPQTFCRGFTTEDHHNGLGLFITLRIIKAHKGSIKVKLYPQKGSVFIIQIPL